MFKSDIACKAIPAISASNQISGMPMSASNINQEVVLSSVLEHKCGRTMEDVGADAGNQGSDCIPLR